MTCSVPTSSSRCPKRQPACLLVTGCYRSGTTLLEKLLHRHPDLCVASQPFPVLYFRVKSAFLATRRLVRRYPLGHLFLEDGYAPEDFWAFLAGYELTRREIGAVFDGLENYPRGLWTPQVLQLRGRVRPGTFLEVLGQLHAAAAGLLGRGSARLAGAKEILCEEYVPFLLQNGHRAIVIVRDPRDMITSLDYRDRDNLTGDHRPLLYSLRLWRKSVACALAHEGQENFLWLRYEDLVSDPEASLRTATEFLEIPDYDEDCFCGGIRGQDGAAWTGNSSFVDHHGISTSSRGAFLEKLPREALGYIEAVCGPEMAALGYEPAGSGEIDQGLLARYREPFETVHARFPADYSSSPERVRRELERAELLSAEQPLSDPAEARRWFLDRRAYARLRQVACPAASPR